MYVSSLARASCWLQVVTARSRTTRWGGGVMIRQVGPTARASRRSSVSKGQESASASATYHPS